MKMRLFISTSMHKERGTALVFSLLILLIMTIIGVAALSNTQMQEQMAGNSNVQSLAFEAASAGVTEALEYGMGRWDDRGCTRACGDSDCSWDDDGYTSFPPLSLDANAAQQVEIEYRLKADCLESPGLEPDPDDPDYDPNFVPPVQMYVTSQGRVSSGGQELATRDIEVRIDDFRTDDLPAFFQMAPPGAVPTVEFGEANSDRFIVDGAGGSAISSSTDNNARLIASEIGSSRIGNYKGGVTQSNYQPPFNSARETARFALEIRAFLQYHGFEEPGKLADFDACQGLDDPDAPDLPFMTYFPGDTPNLNGNGDLNGITYVKGNLSLGGNASGAGLVIVEGQTGWHGGADFQGMVIGLGNNEGGTGPQPEKHFKMNGGGNGETSGMLYIADIDIDAMQGVYDELLQNWNLNESGEWEVVESGGGQNFCWDTGCGNAISSTTPRPSWEAILERLYAWGDTEYAALNDPTDRPNGFGSTDVSFNGGGKHTITYDCKNADDQRRILSECGLAGGESSGGTGTGPSGDVYDGLADPWADPECSIPGRGGSIQAIRSWRENLGWRELLDSPI